MKQLYTLLFYVFLPGVLLRLLGKSRGQPRYRQRIGERLGYYRDIPPAPATLWIHAVSVGECEAAFPLIRSLLDRQPGLTLLVTCATPTGSARIAEVLGDRVRHVYLPYDLPGAVDRFFTHFQPRFGLIMETEIWPNLFLAARARQVPLAILNGRLSARSASGYRRLGKLTAQSLSAVSLIAAQTEGDAEAYRSIGAAAAAVTVTGNIKFDAPCDQAMRARAAELRRTLFGERPVWIAGSTHPGEEEQLLESLSAIRRTVPDLVLVIAPRHPERSGELAKLCERAGLAVQYRSGGGACGPDTGVYLIDGIGELRLFYGTADVAFVGGSLVPHGGQNVLEPAAAGIPVVMGPHVMNFREICARLLAANGAVQVNDAGELGQWVSRFIREPDVAQAYGRRGRDFVEANRGALARTLDRLEAWMHQPSPGPH